MEEKFTNFYNAEFLDYDAEVVGKKKFSQELSKLLEISYEDAREIYRAMCIIMRRSLYEDKSVFLYGVGTLIVNKRKNVKMINRQRKITYMEVLRAVRYVSSDGMKKAINRTMIGKDLDKFLCYEHNPTEDEK